MPGKYQGVNGWSLFNQSTGSELNPQMDSKIYLDKGSFKSRKRAETGTGFGKLSGSGLRRRPKLGLSVGLKSRLRRPHVVCVQVRCYESDLRK